MNTSILPPRVGRRPFPRLQTCTNGPPRVVQAHRQQKRSASSGADPTGPYSLNKPHHLTSPHLTSPQPPPPVATESSPRSWVRALAALVVLWGMLQLGANEVATLLECHVGLCASPNLLLVYRENGEHHHKQNMEQNKTRLHSMGNTHIHHQQLLPRMSRVDGGTPSSLRG